MAAPSSTPRSTSRVNYSNEIHDLSTVQDGAPSLAPSMYYQEKSIADFFPPHLPKKVISEVVATFLLVFVTCGAASLYGEDVTRVSQLGQSLVGGLIVTVMIYATGHISGAHMNPAVTLSFACFRHFPWIQVPFYWAAQFTGAMCAAFVLRTVLHPITTLGTTTPTGPHWHALVIEIIVTFNMMFVTCAVATDSRAVISEVVATFLLVFVTCGAASLYGEDVTRVSQLGQSLVGGLIVTVMIYATGHISGAHMNPAVTLSFACFRHFPWIQVPFYWAAQFTGAMCAAFVLRTVLHPITTLGTTTPTGPHWHALVIEIIVTFNMMFVTCAVATDSRAVISEVVATFLLVFVTCGAASLYGEDVTRVSQLGQSLVGGLIVTVMIYATGHISGAHMNPAVTLSFACFRHFPWIQVPFYWAAQFTGAMCAAFVLRTVLHPITTLGTTTPTGPHWHALVIEIIVTFNMMFVTCAVATDSRAVGELAGLAVGAAVCITSIFAGPVSGGSMNPARTLAPAVASGVYTGLWIYFLGPVIGTLSGAWVYTYIRFEEAPSIKDGPQKLSSFKLRRLQSQRSMAADEFDHV